MHPLSFIQKRTHLCAVARGMEMFANVPNMTPARFDFLYLMRKGSAFLVGMHKRLGLRRQTTWVMAERLVELGLLEKTIVITKAKRKLVHLALTEEGRRRLHMALRAAFNVTVERPTLPETPKPAGADTPAFDEMWHTISAMVERRRLTAQPPKISGREVGRLYSRYVWLRKEQGSKLRRQNYLAKMEQEIDHAMGMAKLLGNTTLPIYRIDYRELANPMIIVKGWKPPRRAGRSGTPVFERLE
jgi:DNA-binding MarR family transcriptional regulator